MSIISENYGSLVITSAFSPRKLEGGDERSDLLVLNLPKDQPQPQSCLDAGSSP